MSVTFILAEKPSVARSFAQALGVPAKNGFWQNEAWTITNCIGHLLSLYDAQDYDPKYQKWTIEDLPVIPAEFRHKPAETTAKQLKLVTSILSKPFDRYIIATDAGREGELIARLVFSHAGISDYRNAERFWTSNALTKDVILSGLQACRPASDYDGLYMAGLYRQIADWLVGINFSRFFTKKLSARFIFGRVQTPVLSMIVTRENDIKAFASSSFFRLTVITEFEGSKFVSYLLNANGGKDHDDDAFLKTVYGSLSESSFSTVTEALVERKTSRPPRLFDLTGLQQAANTTFGFTAAKTLELAQALYEKHMCLSYPRTASRYLSRANLDLFLECLEKLGIDRGQASADNTAIFNDEANSKEDHHALILLNKLPEDASEDEKRVYALIYTSMETIVKKPCLYDQITIRHASGEFLFAASGVNIIEPGWKDTTSSGKENDEDSGEDDERETQKLPDAKSGDTLSLRQQAITKHERKPPKSFTEAAVLAAMKKHGLGTAATRDSVIESLVKNDYCFRKGRAFLPSEKAFFFIKAVMDSGQAELNKYLDVATTGEWEAMLEKDAPAFFREIKQFVSTAIGDLKGKNLASFHASIGPCPLCGSDVLEGKKSWYCGRYKEGCPFTIWKELSGAQLSPADAGLLIQGKKTAEKSMKSKAGNDFKARLYLDKTGKVRFEFKESK